MNIRSYKTNKRKSSSDHLNFVFTPITPNDRNSRFVKQKCCQYLLRLMDKRFFLDEETLEFICWLHIDRLWEISGFVLDRTVKDKRQHYELEIASRQSDLRYYSMAIIEVLRDEKNRALVSDFFQFLKSITHSKVGKPSNHSNTELYKKVSKLQKLFRLTPLEAELCLLLFIASSYEAPENFLSNHLNIFSFQNRGLLCTILGTTKQRLNNALTTTLPSCGIIEVKGFRKTIELTDEVQEALMNPSFDILRKNRLREIKRLQTLPLSYHPIPDFDVNHIVSLLNKKAKTPTHILLYGPPGTGKTSFAYGIAQNLDDPVYEIVHNENTDDKSRLITIRAAINSINRGKDAVFMVDEADNLLNTERLWMLSGNVQDRGAVNNFMDTPGLRIIWIVNNIDSIGPSVLRRFAYSLPFRPFSRAQREKLWENIVRKNRCRSFFTKEDLQQLSREFEVNAAVVDLAVKKAKESACGNRDLMLQAVRRGIDAYQTLANRGYKKTSPTSIDKDYSLEGLNISADIEQVLQQAERFDHYLRSYKTDSNHCFNILLYGPPGSGKSEFARFLARHLDRELIVRRLSDLLNPYVGMTERYIRESFEKAAEEEALLLLDEADALLFPRDYAVRSWEISHTAELLTAMERFRGILICTTNRLAGIDHAAIRRFNHKIKFDFLTPEGNVVFYTKMLATLSKAAPDEKVTEAIRRFRYLTPGDFKTVRDRFVFYKSTEITHDMLVDALREEETIKQEQKGIKKIGF